METTYQAKDQLSISLGLALKQTFDELHSLKSEYRRASHELSLLKMVGETLNEENLVFRDRNEGLEELLTINKEKQNSSFQDYKEACKQENVKVARVLRRTLQALKRSKAALDKLQDEYEKLSFDYIQKSDHLHSLDEFIKNSFIEIEYLHLDRIELLKLLFGPKSPALEQKLLLLEEAYQALKEKAKTAILTKDEELKKLKVNYQELLSKSKEDEQLKSRLVLITKKLEELASNNGRLNRQIDEFKEQLSEKDLEIAGLNQSLEDLKNNIKELEGLHSTAQLCLNQKESELDALHKMKGEYERMHLLFSNIKACMGPELPPMPPVSMPAPDLFSMQKPRSQPIQEELF